MPSIFAAQADIVAMTISFEKYLLAVSPTQSMAYVHLLQGDSAIEKIILNFCLHRICNVTILVTYDFEHTIFDGRAYHDCVGVLG